MFRNNPSILAVTREHVSDRWFIERYIQMAHNDSLDILSAEHFATLLNYAASLAPEVAAKLPPDDSDDWFGAVQELWAAAQAGPTGEPASKEARTRSAVHYTILLLSEDGKYEVLGADFGPVGREPLDPKKHSGAKKMMTRAGIRVVRDAMKGIKSGAMQIATADLPDFIREAVQVPAATVQAAPAAEVQATE
jgi:predicted RNA-binding Zn ribbon-like protein